MVMVINEHCAGWQTEQGTKASIYCSKELYFCFWHNILLISRAQKVNEYLCPPIDQFVASRLLACWSLWEGSACWGWGCTFSIVWISDPRAGKHLHQQHPSPWCRWLGLYSCTLQGQIRWAVMIKWRECS